MLPIFRFREQGSEQFSTSVGTDVIQKADNIIDYC